MSHPVPWIGLAAIVAMFVLPLLPARLFEGPRTIKRHTCGFEVVQPRPPLRAEVRRVSRGRALTRRSTRSSVIKRF